MFLAFPALISAIYFFLQNFLVYRLYIGAAAQNAPTAYVMAAASVLFHALLFGSLLSLLYNAWPLKPKLRRAASLTVASLFIGLCLANFILQHLLHISVWGGLQLIFGGKFKDIAFTVVGTHLKEQDFYKMALVIVAMPSSLWAVETFFRKRQKQLVSSKIDKRHLFLFVLVALIGISVEELTSLKIKNPTLYTTEKVMNPYYINVANPRLEGIRIPVALRAYMRPDLFPGKDAWTPEEKIPEDSFIVVMVGETIRQDFVTPEITPHLSAFADESLKFGRTVSSCNHTHLSWHSIFTSQEAIFWPSYSREKSYAGASTFQWLKSLGYQIHVFTKKGEYYYYSAGDKYFGADLINDLHFEDPASPIPDDEQNVTQFEKFFASFNAHGRHVFVIDYESPHHNYIWPKTFKPPFMPIIDSFNFLKIDYSASDIEKIRNRYKNVMNYTDTLLERSFSALKKANIYENATIGFVGDHGEEFLEHGAMIHAENIFNPQTQIGYFIKPPNKKAPVYPDAVISQVDFFPTLLSVAGIKNSAYVASTHGYDKQVPGTQQTASLIFNSRGTIPAKHMALVTKDYKALFELGPGEPLIAKELRLEGIYDALDNPIQIGSDAETQKQWIENHIVPHLKTQKLFKNVGWN